MTLYIGNVQFTCRFYHSLIHTSTPFSVSPIPPQDRPPTSAMLQAGAGLWVHQHHEPEKPLFNMSHNV
ncbi:MAG: hypothetical protein WD315_04075, partial [Balneolaceae bacterium]